MKPTTNLEEFISYIGENRNIKPLKEFKARGGYRTTPPVFAYTLPLGRCYLYEHFFVFLTDNVKKPGAGLLFNEFAQEVQSVLKLKEWAENPLSIIADIANALGKRFSDDKLSEMLVNPNSYFVRIQDVISVVPGRVWTQLGLPYMLIKSKGQEFFICQDTNNDGNMISAGYRYISGRWHTDVLAKLQKANQP